MIKVTCDNCGKTFKTRDEHAGRKATCSGCGARLRIPSPPPQEVTPARSESPPKVTRADSEASPASRVVPDPGTVDTDDALTPARLPRIGVGLGIAGVAIPLLELAGLIASGIALGSYDEKHHPPGDRKLAITGICLGLGGLILKGCVLTGVLAYLALNQSNNQPAPTPAVAVAPPPIAAPETAAPPPAPPQTIAPPVAPPVTNMVYYYDLGTDQLFGDKPARITPIDAPSGKDMGVRAYVYACGDCSDPTQRTIVWLERNTAAGRKALQNPEAMSIDDTIDSLMAQVEVSEDNGKRWRGYHAFEYLQWRMQKLQTLCPGGLPNECRP